MIVLLLWLAGLILGLAIASGWGWGFLFSLEMWIISKLGKSEEL